MAEDSSVSTDWYVGGDLVLAFTIYQKNAAGVLTTTPQNITGWSLRWDLRRSDTDPDPAVLTKTTSSGITIISGPQGTGEIRIDDTDTDALPARVYRHALKRMDAGSETVLLVGNAVLKKATTR